MTRSHEACGEKVRQISKETKEMQIQLLSICKVAKRRTVEGLKEVRKITDQIAQIARRSKRRLKIG